MRTGKAKSKHCYETCRPTQIPSWPDLTSKLDSRYGKPETKGLNLDSPRGRPYTFVCPIFHAWIFKKLSEINAVCGVVAYDVVMSVFRCKDGSGIGNSLLSCVPFLHRDALIWAYTLAPSLAVWPSGVGEAEEAQNGVNAPLPLEWTSPSYRNPHCVGCR
jgi:hypothetical protein